MSEKNVKITSLEIENVKRITAVSMTVEGKALTVIGGKNAQGKSSVLDSIMWALGGERFKPSNAIHAGAEKGYIKVELDNGVTVERAGINGTLKVTSSRGKGGQSLLNDFVNIFALNLPKFMAASDTEKAKMLLDVFPDLGRKLSELNAECKRLFDERHALGQIADRKTKYAEELPFDFSLPEDPLSGSEMAKKLQAAMSVNAGNQALRNKVGQCEDEVKAKLYRAESARKRVADLESALSDARGELANAEKDHASAQTQLGNARKTATELKDLDTTAIEKELEQIDSTNAAIRANQSKRSAEDESSHLKAQYEDMTQTLETKRAQRIALLSSVKMPLSGLSFDEAGALVFNGQPWDCMSGAEQLRVSAAICAAVNPKCGFVLLDKLESMDPETLEEFAAWLDERDLQAIGTRVSTGDECSIVIEDGHVKETKPTKKGTTKQKQETEKLKDDDLKMEDNTDDLKFE